MPPPRVENLESFVEHAERTMESINNRRRIRCTLFQKDKVMVWLATNWIANRIKRGQQNSIPQEFSDRLRVVMEQIAGFEEWRAVMDGQQKISHKWIKLAEGAIEYLSGPIEVIDGEFLSLDDYAKPGRVIKLPGPKDKVFGDRGLMRGIAYSESVKTVGNNVTVKKKWQVNPEYAHLAMDACHFGHNGLTVGAWFAARVHAFLAGAHHEYLAGVAGTPEGGAWSVVASGEYEDLDQDSGEVLWYTGTGAERNTDPDNVNETHGVRTLRRSLETGNAVRVLRAGSGPNNSNQWAPSSGIRYDGLYVITHERERTNKKGGLYAQFRMARVEGQKKSLGKLKLIPDDAEVAKWNKARNWYNGARVAKTLE